MIDWAKVDTAIPAPSVGRDLYKVRVSDLTANGLFSACSMAEYIQESAFRNSRQLNLGMDALQGMPLAWVWARIALFVRHYPRLNETVRIETWYAGLQGRFGNRFYRMRDDNNVVIACALANFALFDLKNRTIAEWPDFIHARIPEAGELPISFARRTVPKPLIGIPQTIFSPRLGDIDLYNHVNNTKLIEWALSATAGNCKHPFQPSALDIVFRHECNLEDRIQPHVQDLDQKNSNVVLSDPNGKEFIRAYITR